MAQIRYYLNLCLFIFLFTSGANANVSVDNSVLNYRVIGIEWSEETDLATPLKPGDLAYFDLYVEEGGVEIDKIRLKMLRERAIVSDTAISGTQEDQLFPVADGLELFVHQHGNDFIPLPESYLEEYFSLQRFGAFRQILAGEPLRDSDGLLKYRFAVRMPYAISKVNFFSMERSYIEDQWSFYITLEVDYQRSPLGRFSRALKGAFGNNPNHLSISNRIVDMETPAITRAGAPTLTPNNSVEGWIATQEHQYWVRVITDEASSYSIKMQPSEGSEFSGRIGIFDINGNPILNADGQQVGFSPDQEGLIDTAFGTNFNNQSVAYLVVASNDQAVGGFRLSLERTSSQALRIERQGTTQSSENSEIGSVVDLGYDVYMDSIRVSVPSGLIRDRAATKDSDLDGDFGPWFYADDAIKMSEARERDSDAVPRRIISAARGSPGQMNQHLNIARSRDCLVTPIDLSAADESLQVFAHKVEAPSLGVGKTDANSFCQPSYIAAEVAGFSVQGFPVAVQIRIGTNSAGIGQFDLESLAQDLIGSISRVD